MSNHRALKAESRSEEDLARDVVDAAGKWRKMPRNQHLPDVSCDCGGCNLARAVDALNGYRRRSG